MHTAALQHDIGSQLKAALALVPAVITAGAGNDGVEVNGPSINLLGFGNTRFKSGKLLIAGRAALAENETLTLAANLQDDTVTGFSGTPADYGPALASGVVATGPSGGGTVDFVAAIDVDLAGARQFVRAQVTANLSRANTDTVAISAVLVVGGADQLPV